MKNNYQVVIFDDDENILELCRIILMQKGYQVSTFANVDDVIEKVTTHQPDIIFIDNWIPEIGGLAAVQLLKKHAVLSDIPVIYFSANNDIKSLAQKAGADGYLEKPFNIDELEKVVETYVRK